MIKSPEVQSYDLAPYQDIIGPGIMLSPDGETIKIADEILEGSLVRTRLFHDYLFVKNTIGFAPKILDCGTYDGFALPVLASMSKTVVSFDIDQNRLEQAARNRFVAPLIQEGKVYLAQLKAQEMNFPPVFDLVTIIEVFGTGFEGKEEDAKEVLTGAYNALKPGGRLVLTLPSKTAEKFTAVLKPFRAARPAGEAAVYREDISPVLDSTFGPQNIQWFGQENLYTEFWGAVMIPGITVRREGGERGKGIVSIDREFFIPRSISMRNYTPVWWIGICQKPIDGPLTI